MFLFSRKKRREQDAAKEAEIQAIRSDMKQRIHEAAEKTDKVNKLLEEGGITNLIYIATGGDRRSGKR